MIPYSRQNIDNEDIEEIVKVLRSDYLTTGPKIKEFEEKFADFVGSRYAVAVSSGTAALHIACLAVGLQKGDEIVTTPLTFVADGNCALYCQARPEFVDITTQGLINPSLIEEKITNKTKIVIPVDYAGFPCDLKEIRKIADDHELTVIEDCSHSLGAKFFDEKLGSGKYSEMSIFSFHPVKHITTGEGGMITTNSKECYEKLITLRTHGIIKTPGQMKKNEGPWYYEMQLLGYNYRLTDIQCALGLSQLKKIDKFVKRRREIASIYDKHFLNHPNLDVIRETTGQHSSYHLYPILLKNPELRKPVFEALRQKGLWVQVHYIPVYLHPYYKELGYEEGICPSSERFYQSEISIPIHPGMNNSDVDFTIETIEKILSENV